ncbi:MAG: serine protease [Candidatus Omnitrophica bacterium]|nr:serine protease [Candidatus Omnitrophota bacterium]
MIRKIHVVAMTIIFFTTIPYSPINAGSNAIETLTQRLDSIVTVRSKVFDLPSAPEAQVAIDPQTGSMAVGTVRHLQYQEKNGAGVIISVDGRIVTNTHIIFGAQQITVTLRDGTQRPAQVLFISRKDDFSILKIEADRPLPPVDFADLSRLAPGDAIATIGHSDILAGTISGGVISGVGTRQTEQGTEIELLRLNINHYAGDSGGPVLDQNGQLVGLISAKRLSADRQLFAIPADKIHFADINLDNHSKNQ